MAAASALNQGAQDVAQPISTFADWKWMPIRVPMEFGNICHWYIQKSGDDVGLQYFGTDPKHEFPQGLDGVIFGQYLMI